MNKTLFWFRKLMVWGDPDALWDLRDNNMSFWESFGW